MVGSHIIFTAKILFRIAAAIGKSRSYKARAALQTHTQVKEKVYEMHCQILWRWFWNWVACCHTNVLTWKRNANTMHYYCSQTKDACNLFSLLSMVTMNLLIPFKTGVELHFMHLETGKVCSVYVNKLLNIRKYDWRSTLPFVIFLVLGLE